MKTCDTIQRSLETLADEDLDSVNGGRIDVNPCPPQPTFPDGTDCWAGPEYL